LTTIQATISTAEAARILRTSERCVRQWIYRKELDAWKEGRLLKLNRQEVVEYSFKNGRARRCDIGIARK
jgi:excisionase family DNA binding protein